MTNLSIRVGWDEERTVAAPFSGAAQNLGNPLTENPVICIFDNQADVAVEVSIDGGTTTWKTFPAGEALVLDLRANNGNAPNYTIDIGTQFSITGTAGTGSFSLAVMYAR